MQIVPACVLLRQDAFNVSQAITTKTTLSQLTLHDMNQGFATAAVETSVQYVCTVIHVHIITPGSLFPSLLASLNAASSQPGQTNT
eukprot:366189-Chlamydomonas_euryale.AAC.4